MATKKTTKKDLAASLGIANYKGQGRVAVEVPLPKLNPKAKQIVVSFDLGKNDEKAELKDEAGKPIKPAAHMECKRTKAKLVLKPWAEANGYSMTEFGKLNVIVLSK